ncbi:MULTISPECIES: glycerol kinase GlpK [unclassified Paenibacillus]|uniref:glycerol kinase GlpK n=1 Tax=unclassified Paenibacillus TaxID=185978 RepID=UPI000709B701|nr:MULTISPECIES: glycerol kinase GlpK [unclassified Paenibacillus]KQX45408.1 carbohydrate kinase [Paenibacillus sp. Root444D2]KRE45753.1 carbohydrate kinase [Paenibacillus sp. Soil724D2]
MIETFILAIDQSTSGTKALIIDRSGSIIARSTAEHKQSYPQSGWVEHDPLEIYNNVKKTAHHVMELAGIDANQLAGLTITNQRETAVVWDRTSGLPVYPAIVWQCQRTADRCAAYKAANMEEIVRAKTGLLLDPYFSATKWGWILEHAEGAEEKLGQGKLLAGTVDSWLLWKLTGGSVHATDFTNASRTSLFNIHTLEWDKELCEWFHIPSAILPEVKSSDEIFGYTQDPELFSANIPISGIIGDSQAALFGNQCFDTGMAKATYGTGTSVLMNIGEKHDQLGNGLVTTIAWGMSGEITYALEAIIRTSGDTIKWVRDQLGLFSSFNEMEELIAQAPNNEGVYLVPAFVGLGAPYWDPYARAAITGMSRGTGKSHIIRAALESIAYQVKDAVELMQAESGIRLKELRADGGASDNTTLMQFQADVLERSVIKSEVAELSAMGSVYLGGLGVGFWLSLDELKNRGQIYSAYESKMQENIREQHINGWKHAVALVLCTTKKAEA